MSQSSVHIKEKEPQINVAALKKGKKTHQNAIKQKTAQPITRSNQNHKRYAKLYKNIIYFLSKTVGKKSHLEIQLNY